MIEKGDGLFSKRMTMGLCPSCQTALDNVKEDQSRVEYTCRVCKLRIYYAKQEPKDS